MAWTFATPIVAVLLTMVFGGLLFAALGKNPVETIRTIFLDPLFSEFAWFYRPQLLIKGAPLVLIAIGLSFGFRAGIWNIGAEGQYIVGAICGAAVGLAFYPTESVVHLSADGCRRGLGRDALGDDPRPVAGEIRHQ